jgi:ribonuclease-3
MTAAARPASGLSELIGYRFRDPSLLEQALTHSSVERSAGDPRRDYERLEFLGDRVLGLVVAKLLYEGDPDAEAGSMAPRFTALVREETLAEIAEELGLGDFVILSRSERDAGGARKPTILADVCEALIGALFVDGGFAVAEGFVTRHWRGRTAVAAGTGKDAKTALQEWAQSHGLPPPVYHEVARTGPDHDPVFTVEVEVRTLPRRRGDGTTKRRAQQAAAAALLAELVAL